MSDIPESVRANIREMLEEATKGLPFPEPLKHMLTGVCLEMYKAGWRDAYRVLEKTIEMQKDTFNGGGG